MCTALAQDAMCVDIVYPSNVIDSGTTFIPRIAVRNNGSEVLRDVPVSFNIVSDTNSADTIYYDTASSGYIGVGETVLVDFGSECKPEPGTFTVSAITELPGDTNPHNDTCSSPLFVRYIDVAVEITSPRDTEQPGIIPFVVRLTNLGNVPALVPRLDMIGWPRGFGDYRVNIAIPVGGSQTESTIGSYYGGGTETCMAWITDGDMNAHNDTDVVIVNGAGVSDRAELDPGAWMYLTLSPSPLTGSILHVEYSLKQAGPANFSISDITGRPVATRRFAADLTGELPLDLHLLSGGVYLVRLEDGHQSLVQKLVVQR
jgi:hypothetical protein